MKDALKWTVVVGAAVMMISTLFPWVQVRIIQPNSMMQEIVLIGYQAGSLLLIVYGILSLILAFLRRRWAVYPALLALSFFLYRGYDFWSGGILKNLDKSEMEPRFGFYISLAGALIMTIGSIPPEVKPTEPAPVNVPIK